MMTMFLVRAPKVQRGCGAREHGSKHVQRLQMAWLIPRRPDLGAGTNKVEIVPTCWILHPVHRFFAPKVERGTNAARQRDKSDKGLRETACGVCGF